MDKGHALLWQLRQCRFGEKAVGQTSFQLRDLVNFREPRLPALAEFKEDRRIRFFIKESKNLLRRPSRSPKRFTGVFRIAPKAVDRLPLKDLGKPP